MSTANHLKALTGLRGISALLVVSTHGIVPYYPRPESILFAGRMSVYFFFALSGFLLVYRGFCEMHPTPRPSKEQTSPVVSPEIEKTQSQFVMPNRRSILFYVMRRVFRIFPPFIAALILYQLCQGDSLPNAHQVDIWKALYMGDYGSHVWTIRVELLYYMMIPILLYIYGLAFRLEGHRLFKKIPVRAIYLSLVTILAIVIDMTSHVRIPSQVGADIHIHLPVFWYGSLAGIALFYIQKRRLTLKDLQGKIAKRALIAVEIFSYFLLICIFFYNRGVATAYFGEPTWWTNMSMVTISPLFGLLLLVLGFTNGDTSLGRFFSNNLFEWTGEISYSIYLIHYIPLGLIVDLTDIRGFDAVMLAYVLSSIMGWVLYKTVEEPGVKLGNFLIKKIKGAEKPKKKEIKPVIISDLKHLCADNQLDLETAAITPSKVGSPAVLA